MAAGLSENPTALCGVRQLIVQSNGFRVRAVLRGKRSGPHHTTHECTSSSARDKCFPEAERVLGRSGSGHVGSEANSSPFLGLFHSQLKAVQFSYFILNIYFPPGCQSVTRALSLRGKTQGRLHQPAMSVTVRSTIHSCDTDTAIARGEVCISSP